MTEPTDRSARILKASEHVGFTPKQNLEWLVDFAERDFQRLDEDPNFETITEDLWDQWCVLVWRMMGMTFLQTDVRLTANEVRGVQAVIRYALIDRTKGQEGVIGFDHPI